MRRKDKPNHKEGPWKVVAIAAICLSAFFSSANALEFDVRCIEVILTDHNGDKLGYPSTIFYDRDEDEIYITNSAKGQLVLCTADYFPYLAVGGGRGLQSINSCFVDAKRLYVCQGTSAKDPKGHIAILDSAFLPVKKQYFSGFTGADSFIPYKMVVGAHGDMYAVGVNSTPVIVLDHQGQYLRSILPKDEILGFNEPAPLVTLAIGIDGRLYFLSEERGRVFVYDRDEKLLYKFGQKGGDRGKLARPRGIAVDDQNKRIYIVDYLRHTVSIYSQDGRFLGDFGGQGYGRGWFLYPTDVCVDGFGRVLITDTFNQRVQVFEISEKK